MTSKKWIESTSAIGITSKSGRYVGTFAHQDIVVEFAFWISIEFKLYIIKEFQRLKADENDRLKLNWIATNRKIDTTEQNCNNSNEIVGKQQIKKLK